MECLFLSTIASMIFKESYIGEHFYIGEIFVNFIYSTSIRIIVIFYSSYILSVRMQSVMCVRLFHAGARTLHQFRHAIRVSLTRSLEAFGTWNYFQWLVAFTRFTRYKKISMHNVAPVSIGLWLSYFKYFSTISKFKWRIYIDQLVKMLNCFIYSVCFFFLLSW